MIRRRLFRSKSFYTPLLIIILFIFSACSASPSQPAPQPTLGFDLSSDEVSPTLGFDLSKDEDESPNLLCPSERTLYTLFYSHLEVTDIDYGEETFYLKFTNTDVATEEEPTFFQFWIEPSGIVSTEHIINQIKIGYHGTANHPKSKSCPVQTFDGVWELKAEITGRCEEGFIYLHIKEEWVDPILHSDCGDAIGPGPGVYSAPVLDPIFDLSSNYPVYGISNPEDGMVHVNFAFNLSVNDNTVPPLVINE